MTAQVYRYFLLSEREQRIIDALRAIPGERMIADWSNLLDERSR